MDSLVGRQLRPHSLSDVMHQADAIFSHTVTLSYVSVSSQGYRSAAKLIGRMRAATRKQHKVAAPKYYDSCVLFFFLAAYLPLPLLGLISNYYIYIYIIIIIIFLLIFLCVC